MSFDDFDADFDAADVMPATRDDDTTDDGDDEDVAELQFETVWDWFDAVFREMVERWVADSSDHRWCAHWHEHPEVYIRITALWRSWEHLSTDPDTGMSVWMRDHLDHHLGVILSGTGPFARCKTSDAGSEHHLADRLPSMITADAAKQAMAEVA